MYKLLLTITFIAFFSKAGFSQKRDTITIDAGKVNTKVLQPQVNRYLVYFKNGIDSPRINYQLWTRTVDVMNYKGRAAISVTQEWEDNTSVVHKVYSVNDKKNFAPLFHEVWWKRFGTFKFDFLDKTAEFNDVLLTSSDTAKRKKMIYDAFEQALPQYVLNWHLDLEVFSILPYKDNTTFSINFYDPGSSEPARQLYTVSGSAFLTGYDNQKVDCWLLTHDSPGNKETFYVSKKTREVLKLEQEFNGRYRFKVKLGFSS